MTRAFSTALLASAALLAGCATNIVPVKELSLQQAQQLPAYTEISLQSAGFQTSALAMVHAPNGQQTDAQRAGSATSPALAGVAKQGGAADIPPTPATSGEPPVGQKFDFKKTGDSAQAWATMTRSGMPFLYANAFGKSDASGTAAWRARVQMPPNATNLYVQFMLPTADLQGADEAQGPSQWQSRLLVEVQMNGHPVWSSENTRISLVDGTAPGGSDNCGSNGPRGPYLAAFGRNLGFDSSLKSSTAQKVTLNLGSFLAGQSVDVTMIVRAGAKVLRPCCHHRMDNTPEEFCSRASATVSWDNTAQPVRFWVGPNLP